LVQAAVQGTFQESIDGIADLTGLSVSKRSLEELLVDAARDFDVFYQERVPAPAAGSLLVAAVDGKGVPMVKPDGARPTVRLTKGQKVNRKRMATVAAVFTKNPWVRTPEQVVESLFRTGNPANGPVPPRPENKRVWASLLKGKTGVIQEVAQEMQRRDPEGIKTRVALTDGDRAWQILVEGTLGVTLVLELLHVLEKLWKAAHVFHAEGSLEAELWVLDRTLRILFGEVSQVVKGFARASPNAGCSGPSVNHCAAWRTISTAIAFACAMTNISLKAGPSPVALSRARARTSSRIGWNVRECAGPKPSPRLSSSSELFT
jgi:hypothetical protein